MITKFTPHIIFLLFISTFASAQDHVCGVVHPTDPAVIESVQAIEEHTQEWILEQQNSATTREIITIPVVVHVIWYDESEKFSELEIQAQIDGLTADFRKMNENRFTIPEEFQPLAADVEIEFCLATVTENGQETNGIIYKYTDQLNIGTSSNGIKRIHYDQHGGSDAWNTNDYINIWVGQMENFEGLATFPGTAPVPEEDGIVIDPDFFGFFCSTSNGSSHGRTLTHEMGHFLNLRHIWGTNSGSGNCDSDDFVSDTPRQDISSKGCPTHPQESCGSNNMFMNYMDYTDDACLSMFTHGQKMRMLATLAPAGPRGSLRNSNGCDKMRDKSLSLNPDKILIYPNPAADCIHIDLDLDADTDMRMEIFNSIGQPVYSSRIFAKDLRTFDVSRFSNGVYFIYFETNSNGASKKMVIERR